MRHLIAVFALIVVLSSCSANKTVYITNKTGKSITLLVDSAYLKTYPAFTDSLNGVRIADKEVFDYGKGKWTKSDKSTWNRC